VNSLLRGHRRAIATANIDADTLAQPVRLLSRGLAAAPARA